MSLDAIDSDEEQPLPKRAARSTRKKSSLAAHRWTRLVHVYTSMVAFTVVLFFAVTGLTLNHPEWTFGSDPKQSMSNGTLPAESIKQGTVDWLAVSEYFRNSKDVHGSVTDHRSDANEGAISFKAPGYQADATFKLDTRAYELRTDALGFVAVINDLHKGRDSRHSWKWLIDASAVVLIVISLTGLLLQFFLRKRRRSAYSTAVIGTIVAAVFTWIALG